MLQEQDKLKLDGIVQQMIANKEPESNIQLVVNDFKQKYSKQEVQQPVKKEVGGLQSFVQSVAKPFLKVASTVSDIGAQSVSLGADLLGRSDIANKIDTNRAKNEGIDYGYFGNVTPMGQTGTFQDVKEAVGVGAEIGSYAIGGGGAGTAVKTGLKGLIKEGVKEGVKTGVASGGLLSFGQSMQEAESSPMDVAYNTLFGAGVGGVAGGVLGAATPVAVKAVNKVKSFLNVPSLEAKLADGYKKIFNPTARQAKADTRFGNDSFKFLAQEMPDLPVTVNSAGRVEADSAIEMAKLKYSAEASAYKPIIRNSGKYIDIDQTIAKAKAVAKKEFDGTDLTKAEQQIDNEVEAYLRNNPQDINVTENGKRFVTLSRADDIKSYSWARGKGWGTPEAEVWNDTNNIIGHALKDAIEKELPSAPIKAMNKRLGQWKNAIDMLERRNAQVSGSGGKLSKLLNRQTGSIVGGIVGSATGDQGSVMGGIGGAGAGFMTATALAAMMANPNVRLFVVRQMLNRLSKAGRKDMIQEAEQILKEQASKYLLPAAGKSSYVEQPIILPKSVRETNLGLDEVKNMTQSQPKPLVTTEPKAAPTKIQNTNVKNAIPNTIPQKGLNEVSGGVAGIEVKTDENGKTQITFNPGKAVAGILGVSAFKKIPSKLREDALDTMSLFKKFKSSDFVNSKGKLNFDAWSVVEDLFEKSSKGTITREDIKAAQEVHFMLKGNKK